jgi:phosphoglycolate phosphatase-like HAD superfamily hydrolase
MSGLAILWIRDGVLVERMHVNPVAFAFAALSFAEEHANTPAIEELIQFAFEKSGVSFAEKLQLYHQEVRPLVNRIEPAAKFYNLLATEAAKSCRPFPGAVELLAELKAHGTHNFITSAVEQDVIDTWASSSDGEPLAQQFTEVLGRRTNFSKGRDHFAYVFEKYKPEQIYLIADAPAEIKTGRELASEFPSFNVGFANLIDRAKVADGYTLVRKAWSTRNLRSATVLGGSDDDSNRTGSHAGWKPPLRVQLDRLNLPDTDEIVKDLIDSGADAIVTGDSSVLYRNLRGIFRTALTRPS